MGEAALALQEAYEDKYIQMTEYLSSEGRYWIDNDRWELGTEACRETGIKPERHGAKLLADFSGYPSGRIKTEIKYFLLYSLKNGLLTTSGVVGNYRAVIPEIGEHLKAGKGDSFSGLSVKPVKGLTGRERERQLLLNDLIRFKSTFQIWNNPFP